MYVFYKSALRSLDHCCNVKVKLNSLFTVELNVTVIEIKYRVLHNITFIANSYRRQ
jgi:hypothetical protein